MPPTDRSALCCPACGSTDLIIVNHLEFCWPFTRNEGHQLLVIDPASGSVDWTIVNDDQLRCTACKATFPLPEDYEVVWLPKDEPDVPSDDVSLDTNPKPTEETP